MTAAGSGGASPAPTGRNAGAALPARIRDYAARALPSGDSGVPRAVRITQTGEMVQRPGGRPLRFRATQELAVREVAFAWRARFPVARVLWLDVVDSCARGEGSLEARLCGLVPVLRSRGPAVTKAQTMRYLAELPWVPYALAANSQLQWNELEDGSIEVTARAGSGRAAVRFELDSRGDIVRASAPDRPRDVEGGTVETPWSGLFFDYELVGGVRIPTRAEVRWDLPEGPFTYWRGEVTSLQAARSDRSWPS